MTIKSQVYHSSLPAPLPAALFAPSRRLIVVSYRKTMETQTRFHFAFARPICLLVYRLDAIRPASLVEKRGENTEIAIRWLNGFGFSRHRLIFDEQGNRRVCIFVEILFRVRIERAVELDLALRLPRRQLLVNGAVRELLAELGWNLSRLDQLPDPTDGEESRAVRSVENSDFIRSRFSESPTFSSTSPR